MITLNNKLSIEAFSILKNDIFNAPKFMDPEGLILHSVGVNQPNALPFLSLIHI